MKIKSKINEDWSSGIILYFDMPLDDVENAVFDDKLRIPAYVDGEWSETSSLRVYAGDIVDGYGNVNKDSNLFQFVYPIYDKDINYVIYGGRHILDSAIRTRDISALRDAGLDGEVRTIKYAFAKAGVIISNVKVTLRNPAGELTAELTESLKENLDEDEYVEDISESKESSSNKSIKLVKENNIYRFTK